MTALPHAGGRRRRPSEFVVLAAAAAIALGLTACGSSGGSSRGSPGPPSDRIVPPTGSALSRSAEQLGGLKGTVVVFAAASLKGTFDTLAAAFERAHPGVQIVPSFGGSDTLAAQIVAGAPVDVFASANLATMSTASNSDDLQGAPSVFAKNALEIAVPAGNSKHITRLADLTKAGVKLAMCAPAVPCGAAAATAFRAAKLTPHPVTLEQDVTSVLTKVELGEVDAGLVYRTDVASAGSKVTGVSFPEAASAVNSYPIAVVTTGKNRAGGEAFEKYVLSAAGQQVLQAAGFAKP
ncbi:MAG: molybdate ABC transporter substrate-binding protein [Acidothermaceae bacterium]